MATPPTEERKQKIQQLLRQRRLAEAFGLLRQLTAETSNWQLSDKTAQLEQSYRYMVRYVAEGIDDPKREEIYADIVEKAFELCDIATTELIAQTSPRLYFGTLRMERMHPQNTTALLQRFRRTTEQLSVADELPADEQDSAKRNELQREKEDLLTALFKHIWVTFPLPADETSAIREIFSDSATTADLKEIVMCAMFMSLMEHYSESTLLQLMDIYTSPASDSKLQMKALCCSLLVMYRYRHIIGHSHPVELRIANLADNSRARKDLMTVFLQFIRSRGTERIVRKVQEELVPKLKELSPEIRRKIKNTGLTDDLEDPEQNPDWQELLDKSGISQKMQELNKMQMEGGDVFLSSFSHLKSFPFFGNIANWFLPFDARHSAVSHVAVPGLRPLMAMVDHSGAFCDSDKYSFMLSLASVPQQQRDMMLGQFDEQSAQIAEMQANDLPNPEKERENTANKFMQNLYRFFHLFNRKTEFHNPFHTQLNLTEVPFVADILSDTDDLRLIAEFYFKQEHYADALTIFRKIAEKEQASAGILQKMGFCHENLKHYTEAAECYEKVDLMKPDDLWTLKHLAFCHRTNGNMEEAIEYYRKAEKTSPDNAAIANNLGNCLLAVDMPEEALKCFYKVDYLAPKGARTMRPVAWCLFLTGNFSQSADCYSRILSESPTADDHINRGHALLCNGSVKEAFGSYMAAVHASGIQSVADTVTGDLPLLKKAGADPTTTALLLDSLRFATENTD